MSKKVDLEKLRTVNYGGRTRGQARVRELRDEATGRKTGAEIDRPDGSVEAVVRPKPVRYRVSMSGGD